MAKVPIACSSMMDLACISDINPLFSMFDVWLIREPSCP
jgi:hypothetical protein